MNNEVSRSPDYCGWLVRSAAHRAPPDLKERLEEEWLADLAERSGRLARLRFALGCAWASRVIVAQQPARLAPAGAAVRLSVVSAEQLSGLSRRTSSLVVVAGLHAVVIYACWMSLATTHGAAKPLDHLDNIPLERTVSPKEQVSPLPPTLYRIPVAPPEDPPPLRIETTSDPLVGEARIDLAPEGSASLPPPHAVARVPGAPAAGFPNVDDFYPLPDIRAGHQGGVAVQVCVDPRGALTGEPSIAQSSGFARLDLAAVRLAKAGSGHYRPTSEDGRPVTACFAYMVRFRLKS